MPPRPRSIWRLWQVLLMTSLMLPVLTRGLRASTKATEAAQSATNRSRQRRLSRSAYSTTIRKMSRSPGSGGLASALRLGIEDIVAISAMDAANTLAGLASLARRQRPTSGGWRRGPPSPTASTGWGLRKVLAVCSHRQICLVLPPVLISLPDSSPLMSALRLLTIGPGVGWFGGKKHQTTLRHGQKRLFSYSTRGLRRRQRRISYMPLGSYQTAPHISPRRCRDQRQASAKPVGRECFVWEPRGPHHHQPHRENIVLWQTGNEVNTDTYAWVHRQRQCRA